MKLILFLLIFFFIFQACNSSNEKSSLLKVENITDSIPPYLYEYNGVVLNKKITDTLMKLPFVKKADAYFDSLSDHKEGVTFMLDTFRNKINAIAIYYQVDHVQKLFDFMIDPKTFEIKVGDIASGEYITVAEYQKLNPVQK